MAGKGDSISFTLRYNATLLDPLKQPGGRIENGLRLIDYKLPFEVTQDSILTEIFFRAALGNDSVTTLEILDPVSTNRGYDFDSSNGSFKLLDLCREGGVRLLHSSGEPSGIVSIEPNPASEKAEIKLNLIEKGRTLLKLSDNIGNNVLFLAEWQNETGEKSIELDISGLSSGLYYLILQTPSGAEVRKMMKIR
jgi:hypothetical protein